jgi:hypothetical protein
VLDPSNNLVKVLVLALRRFVFFRGGLRSSPFLRSLNNLTLPIRRHLSFQFRAALSNNSWPLDLPFFYFLLLYGIQEVAIEPLQVICITLPILRSSESCPGGGKGGWFLAAGETYHEECGPGCVVPFALSLGAY